MPSFIELRREIVAVTGPDRASFLQGLVTNDVTKAPVYAALLSPQGKFQYDFFIVSAGEALLLDVAWGKGAEIIKRLSPYKLRSKLEMTESRDWTVLAVTARPPEMKGAIGFADPRLAALGWRILVPRDWLPDAKAKLLEAGLSEGAPDEYEALRLAHGVPDGVKDIPENRGIPLEYNLDALNAISWDKGCYMGQELTARTRYRGLVRKRLLPVDITGPLPAPGAIVKLGDSEAGEMRSGRGQTGLVLLRLEHAKAESFTSDGATLKLRWPSFLDRSILDTDD